MPHIELYDIGEVVITTSTPRMMAKILSKSASSITVEAKVIGRGHWATTTWSPFTIVRLARQEDDPRFPEDTTESPTTPTTGPSQPLGKSKPVSKPAKQEKDKTEPKARPTVDCFGVREGSMAAEVNKYLLKKRKGITVQDVLDNVSGSKKDNVTSHLRRMVKDGLIINKGEGRNLLVSVPKDKK
jgi:hypothetical protein